jgi:hypothetical protein
MFVLLVDLRFARQFCKAVSKAEVWLPVQKPNYNPWSIYPEDRDLLLCSCICFCKCSTAFVFASAQPKLKSNCLCKSLITICGAYILKAGTCYSAVAFVFASVQPNFSSLKHLPLKSINGSPLCLHLFMHLQWRIWSLFAYLCIFREGFEVYCLIFASVLIFQGLIKNCKCDYHFIHYHN